MKKRRILAIFLLLAALMNIAAQQASTPRTPRTPAPRTPSGQAAAPEALAPRTSAGRTPAPQTPSPQTPVQQAPVEPQLTAEKSRRSGLTLDDGIVAAGAWLKTHLAPKTTDIFLHFTSPARALTNYVTESLNTISAKTGTNIILQTIGNVSEANTQIFGWAVEAQTIVTGTVTPLGDPNRDNYQLDLRTMNVESQQSLSRYTAEIQLDSSLRALLNIQPVETAQLKSDSESKSKPESASGSAPRHWLYLGVRGGYSMRFYTNPEENSSLNSDGGFDNGNTFEAGIRAAGQVLPWLALQAEGIFTMDTAFDKANTAEYKSMSLMFPLVAKVTFRPGQWLIAPFGGAYMSVPLGEMNISKDSSGTMTESQSDWGRDNWMGLGWTAGLEVGRRLGPGTLFLDIRYSADFVDTVVDGVAAYRRTGATVSLGYDFALFKKK